MTRYNEKDLKVVAAGAARRVLEGTRAGRRRASNRLADYYAKAEDPAAILDRRKSRKPKRGDRGD